MDLERVVEGLLHEETARNAVARMTSGCDEILAQTLVVFGVFIPFFAFIEGDRVMGWGKPFEWSFGSRGAGRGSLGDPGPSGTSPREG